MHIDIQIHIHPCVESPVLYKICIAVLVNDTFKRIAIDVVHIAIYYICNIPFIEIQENTVSNEMAGVTVIFLNYDNSLQQNKNTMFDDKEQVFCEEKKNGFIVYWLVYWLRY